VVGRGMRTMAAGSGDARMGGVGRRATRSSGARRGWARHRAAGSGTGSGDGGGTERRRGRAAPPLRSSPPAHPSLIDANDLSRAVAATGEEEGVFIPPDSLVPVGATNRD
jgi:hypothetical protein